MVRYSIFASCVVLTLIFVACEAVLLTFDVKTMETNPGNYSWIMSNMSMSNQDAVAVMVSDYDRSLFTIEKLNIGTTAPAPSCYKITKNKEIFQFCYPTLHIGGLHMCGSAVLYDILAKSNDQILPAHSSRDHCPDGSMFKYLVEFGKTLTVGGDYKRLYLNRCSKPLQLAIVHRLLNPNAAYLLTVRSLPERLWSEYNTLCTWTQGNQLCPDSPETMNVVYPWYRDPTMFEQMLFAANYPLAKKSGVSCAKLNYYYNIQQGAAYLDMISSASPPLLVAVEALESSRALQKEHLARIEAHVLSTLKVQLKLVESHVVLPKAGSSSSTNDSSDVKAHSIFNSASSNDNSELSELLSTYKISEFQPMLDSTVAYITSCWAECENIAKRALYPYHCSTGVKRTTGDDPKERYLKNL